MRDLNPSLSAFFIEGEEALRIFETVCLKQPRVAIDLIVLWNLDELAEEIGLEVVRDKDNSTLRLMSHDSYRRESGVIRQVKWG